LLDLLLDHTGGRFAAKKPIGMAKPIPKIVDVTGELANERCVAGLGLNPSPDFCKVPLLQAITALRSSLPQRLLA
jgi:hypothetical protein